MWRFRKSFSPLPGVRLTLSPSGISTSVGAGPLRITAGIRGAHLTATVPGTGLSFKTRLSESPSSVPAPSPAIPWPQREPPRIGSTQTQFEPQVEQIESAGSAVLTTPGIAEFRRLLDLARVQHAETASELERARAIDRAATDHYLSWKNGWLLRHLRKKRFAALAEAAEDAAARRVELEEQEVLARLGTQIDIPDAVAKSFSRVSDAFAQLSRSSRIWDTVSHRAGRPQV